MTNDPVAMGIKNLIKAKGYKQKAIAERAGLTPNQFSEMLNDRRLIKATDIPPIADALGVGVAEIYTAGQEARYAED